MTKSFDKWQKDFEQYWLEKFGKPYNPNNKMSEKDNAELYNAYEKCYDYDPTEEEVRAKYSDEFNEWLDNL